jgi:hypothetical protein
MTLLTNGRFRVRRETHPEPYEAPTLTDLGTWDGLLTKQTTERLEAGGLGGRTLWTARLSLDPAAPVDTRCRVTDPAGHDWTVAGVAQASGFGLDRQVVELIRSEGEAL